VKTSFPWKQALLLFGAVLLAYLAVFNGIEWARQRKGGWQVWFLSDAAGVPRLEIKQPALKLSAQLQFADETVNLTKLSEQVVFDRPRKPVPFGKVIYEDLTFLPGVVTFDFFGHEVELLPRVLIVNKAEVGWGANMKLTDTNRLDTPPKPAKGYD
jgi:hypothetical protein